MLAGESGKGLKLPKGILKSLFTPSILSGINNLSQGIYFTVSYMWFDAT